jgi:aminoglycoside phosphotransferase (APT) family kinase protein
MTGVALPDDLVAATAQMQVLEVEPLARLVTDGPTGSWCLTLDDGARVKGQMLWSPHRSERARCMIAALAHVGVPPVVAFAGRAIVQEWVDGATADASRHAAAAGRLLGQIHTTPIPPCARAGGAWQPDAARTRAHLESLVDRDALEAAEGARIVDLLPDAAQCAADFVVTHGDLAPGNVVVIDDGASAVNVVPVDNEACDAAPARWDVARTWYRWPMPAGARTDFRHAYEATTGRDLIGDDFVGWLAAVLVDAAAYRFDGQADAQVPLQALRTVARGTPSRDFAEQMFLTSPEICDDVRP